MAVEAVPQGLVEEIREAFLKEVEDKGLNSIHPKDLSRVKTDDHWLRRFIAHSENDVTATLNMMWTALTWRKEQGANEINENNVKMELLIKGAFFPHGKDINGKTLFVFKCKMHSKGAVDMDELKRCVIYWFERMERMTKGDQISLFFDMEGCSLSNMDMELIKYLIGLFKEYYPYFLNYIIIFDMAWVLSAAFRIIKTWLPEKAIEKLKMVTKKDVLNYVPKNEALKSWGGDNDYAFRFVSENPQKTEPESNGTSVRKVHFQDGSPMSDKSPIVSPNSKEDGGPLEVTPNAIIAFLKEGTDLVSTVDLHNTDSTASVVFKVKTTSPEKFKVKPSTGCLKAGAKDTVTVTLLPGFQLGGLSKDKFLIMSLVLEEGETANSDISELWKASSGGNRKIYQTRLRCVQSGDMTRNGNLATSYHSPTKSDSDNQLSKLTTSVAQIRDNQVALTRSLRTLLLVQIAQFAVLLLLGVLYLWSRNEIDSDGYCRDPKGALP